MARNVQIQMPGYKPQQEESTMDKILKGVQIANGVLGIGQGVKQMVSTSPQEEVQSQQAQLIEAQRRELERKSQGRINPMEALQMGLVQGKKPIDSSDAQRVTLPTVGGQNQTFTKLTQPQDEKQRLQLEKLKDDAIKRQRFDKKTTQNISETLDVIDNLEGLKTKAKQFDNQLNPLAGRFPNIVKQYAFSPEYIGFESEIGAVFDKYRKAVTGAQASEKELQILKKRFPSETDRLQNFVSKANERQRNAKNKILNLVISEYAQGKTQPVPPQVAEIITEQLTTGDIKKSSDKEKQILSRILVNSGYGQDINQPITVNANANNMQPNNVYQNFTPTPTPTPTPQLQPPSNIPVQEANEFNIESYINKYGK